MLQISIIDYKKSANSPFNTTTVSNKKILLELNSQKIIAQNNAIQLFDADENPVWKNPLIINGRPNELHYSDDRLLLTTYSNEYTAWGVLGPALLIDMRNGFVIAELKGATGAAFHNGSFILGLEGYEYFNTWLYDRNGNPMQEWRSYGHYIVDNDCIRVFETDRILPTTSRIVKLHLDGSIEVGPKLISAQISQPLLLKNRSCLIFDCGQLRIIDDNLVDRLLVTLIPIPENDSWRFTSQFTINANKIFLDLYERSKDAPIQYTSHHWEFVIKPEQ